MTPSIPFLSDLPIGPGALSLAPFPPTTAPVKGTADFAGLLGGVLPPDPDRSVAAAETAAAVPGVPLPAAPGLASPRPVAVTLNAAEPAGGTILPGRGAPLPDASALPFAGHAPVSTPAAARSGAAVLAARPLSVPIAATLLPGAGEEGALPPPEMPLAPLAGPAPAPTAGMLPAPDAFVTPAAPPLLPAARTPLPPADPEVDAAVPAVPAAPAPRLVAKTGEVAALPLASPGPAMPRDPAVAAGGGGAAPSLPEAAESLEESAPPIAAGPVPMAGWVQPVIAPAAGADPAAPPPAAAGPDRSAIAAAVMSSGVPASPRPVPQPPVRGKSAERAAAEPTATPLSPLPTAPGEAPAIPAPGEVSALAEPMPAGAPPLPPVPASVAIPASLVPERVEAPGQAQAQPRAEPQIESTIAQVGELREALRAARPEMTLRHAEFGLVSVRIEAAATPDNWRAVLASRDPGFVPAIQAALADRAVAALSAAPDSGGGGTFGTGQNGTGDQRYGASPNGGQGGSQPYLGHSGQRDGEAAPDHRRPSTAAALAARGEEAPGSPAPRDGGLFA